MNPKKRKDISKETAEKLSLSEELVDDIANHYYKYLQQKLSSLDHLHISVKGLGTFNIVEKRLRNKIRFFDKKVTMLFAKDSPSLMKYEARMNSKIRLEKMEDLLVRLLQERKDKKIFKENRYEQRD